MTATATPAPVPTPPAPEQEFFQALADTLATAITRGDSPFQRERPMPFNPVTGKPFHGYSADALKTAGHEDPRWLTAPQANRLGATLNPGAAGVKLIFTDTRGARPKVVAYTLYNAEQMSGIGAYHAPAPLSAAKREAAARLIDDFKAPASAAPIPGSKESVEKRMTNFLASYYLASELRSPFPEPDAAFLADFAEQIAKDPFALSRASTAANEAVRQYLSERHSHKAASIDADKMAAAIVEETKHMTSQELRGMSPETRSKVVERVEKRYANGIDRTPKGISIELAHGKDDVAAFKQICEENKIDRRYDPANHVWIVPEGTDVSVFASVMAPTAAKRPVTAFQAGHTYVNAKDDVALTVVQRQGNQLVLCPPGHPENKFAATLGISKKNEEYVRLQDTYLHPGMDQEQTKHLSPANAKGYDPERRQFLYGVSYEKIAEARAAAQNAGFRDIYFDKGAKTWFVDKTQGGDLDKLAEYVAPRQGVRPEPALAPQELALKALIEAGFSPDFAKENERNLDNGLPIMDGKKHRLLVPGDKGHDPNAGALQYSFQTLPNGMCIGGVRNFRDGFNKKFSTRAPTAGLSREQIQEADRKSQEASFKRVEENKRICEQAAKLAKDTCAVLPDLKSKTPYLAQKGVELSPGLKAGNGGCIVMPITDLGTGEIRTFQKIYPKGQKRLLACGPKAGNGHMIGGYDAGKLKHAGVIAIAEGLATGLSVNEGLKTATGRDDVPVCVAVDANNLEAVAKKLHEVNPSAQIVIFGDDDVETKSNPGRAKAEAAAMAVGGRAVFPIATDADKANAAQKGKTITDFNDLAVYGIEGKEGVARQVGNSVNALLAAAERAQAQEVQQQREKTPEKAAAHSR